ncbi:hypothetical protein ACIOG7_32915 [Streptomyces sp. NPDC087894]|uniref:hypothetical protein n=1 Tax=Streptomyces sp. NPDC087894 TaxID=3365816 RepID=UPI0038022499
MSTRYTGYEYRQAEKFRQEKELKHKQYLNKREAELEALRNPPQPPEDKPWWEDAWDNTGGKAVSAVADLPDGNLPQWAKTTIVTVTTVVAISAAAVVVGAACGATAGAGCLLAGGITAALWGGAAGGGAAALVGDGTEGATTGGVMSGLLGPIMPPFRGVLAR